MLEKEVILLSPTQSFMVNYKLYKLDSNVYKLIEDNKVFEFTASNYYELREQLPRGVWSYKELIAFI